MLNLCPIKISQQIRDEHGDGSTAVTSAAAGYAAEALAGMQAKSEEFAAQGNRVYLPLTD
ncbi:thiamine biosynthesis protein ThiC [Streptomyces sp. CB01881]|uniref:thiamine biosynthesis protein ThiC n=1 Tax=Streptomyces sp. CB01881 TaxID=2078691 RepID=UPI001884094E|nr:thiamine biosynthesis protein ThiC [Streptomyces sp. CB01881]